MKYLLLAYRDEKRWEAMSARERAAFEEVCRASEQDLINTLHLIGIMGLQNNAALTVRIVNGAASLFNGPVCRSPEQLKQLLVIEARDLNAAIQIASGLPQARGGPIEVRPMAE